MSTEETGFDPGAARSPATYIERPIPPPGAPRHDSRMTTFACTTDAIHASCSRSTGGNPADLLGWAHRLSDSAEGIGTAAASPAAAAAIAAALGHVETALASLERGTEEMEHLARARLTTATAVLGEPWNDVVVARTARDFDDLARALANARRACERVRRSAGPMLAELTAV